MKPKKPIFDAEGYQTNLTDLNGTPLPDLRKVKVRPLHPRNRKTPTVFGGRGRWPRH